LNNLHIYVFNKYLLKRKTEKLCNSHKSLVELKCISVIVPASGATSF